MNRREFSKQATALSAMGLTSGLMPWQAAHAADPAEGTNYVRLGQRAPVAAPAGKIEVVEFFWYGCPHCFHFEPSLVAWAARLPADVSFRRMPVAFREVPFVAHQRLYFTIEALGLVSTLHPKVFHALHVDQLKLDKPELIADFVARQGVDKDKFMAMYNSFGMQTRTNQARTLADAYKIDGVPAIGVAGRYYTSVSMNGTPEKALATTDFLIAQARKNK